MVVLVVGVLVLVGFQSQWLCRNVVEVVGSGCTFIWASCVAVLLVLCNMVGLVITGAISMCYIPTLVLSFWIWVVGVCMVVTPLGLITYVGHCTLFSLGRVVLLFLPSIELLSVVLRPITLGVRLATNISSGHILFVLGSVAGGGTLAMLVIFPCLVLLVLLELFVSLLQGCVFAILVVMYVNI